MLRQKRRESHDRKLLLRSPELSRLSRLVKEVCLLQDMYTNAHVMLGDGFFSIRAPVMLETKKKTKKTVQTKHLLQIKITLNETLHYALNKSNSKA